MDAEVTNAVIKWMKNEEDFMRNHKCSDSPDCDHKKSDFVILLVPGIFSNEYKPYVKCRCCGAIFDPSQDRVILGDRTNEG